MKKEKKIGQIPNCNTKKKENKVASLFVVNKGGNNFGQ